MEHVCKRTLIAELGINRVTACSCGVIHINTGPVTIHMDKESMRTFTAVLARSMVVLDETHTKTARPRLTLVHDNEALAT